MGLKLYERVWQTPTVHLCKEFGLSDVGFAKLCKRHKIPQPYPRVLGTEGCRRKAEATATAQVFRSKPR